MPSSEIASIGSEPLPAARLASFYFAYYAALGAFVPYWSLFLKDRGQDVAAISVLMSLWYGTRIFAPSAWGWLAGRSMQPIRWLRIGCALTLTAFLVFLVPLDFRGLLIAMCVFCFAYNAVMPQFEALTFSHLAGRSERYGRIRVWGSIGYIATVVGFGVVFDHWPIGYLPLLLAPLFVGLVLSSFSNYYGRPRADEMPVDQGFRQRLRLPEVRVFFIVAVLMQISFGAYYTFFSIYLDQHGYRTSALGGYWAVAVAIEIAVFVYSVRIFQRWSARSVVIASLVTACLRWWVTALWPDNVVLMI
ncbi:MAG: MFS transporter, partial [Dokdonella sp.]